MTLSVGARTINRTPTPFAHVLCAEDNLMAFANSKKLKLIAALVGDEMNYIKGAKSQFPQSELKGKKYGMKVTGYLADPGTVHDGIVANPDAVNEPEINAYMNNKNSSVELDLWDEFVNTEDGEKFMEEIGAPRAKNLAIVYEGTFDDSNAQDFTVQLGKAQEAGADILFLPIYYDPASLILTQANGMGYKPTFFGVDGMDGILGLEGFDTSLAEGVYLLTPFSADATDELTVNFVNKYKEKFGEVPNQFAADAYDCIYAIAQACEAAGVTADMSADEICTKLVEQFTSMTFSGLTGSEMTWNANGEVTKSPKAVVIQNGVYVGVED